MGNKVFYGLKNVHISKLTEETLEGVTTVTYETPKALKGNVSMSLTPEGESATFNADNSAFWTGSANSGYKGTLEVALVPQWFRQEYLGETVDTTKNIVERSSDQAKSFAMLFEFDGDQKARKFVLYNCKASRPKFESTTTGEKIEPNTESLEFTAIPIPDGSGIIKAESGEGSTNFETWYTDLVVPTIEIE